MRTSARPTRRTRLLGSLATTGLILGVVVVPAAAAAVPPTTTINSGPADGSSTNVDSATFDFTADDGAATFECDLDGAGYVACDTGTVTYSSLSEAAHTFSVKATNGAGTEDPAQTRTWTVDLTAPVTTILTGPAEGEVRNDNNWTFTWGTEAGATYICTVGVATIDPCDGGTFGLSDTTDGTFTFGVSGTDEAGNVEDPGPSRTFTVDTVAPDTTITAGPTGTVPETTAAFAFTSSEDPATFMCNLDAAGWAACSSPLEITGLSDGEHTLEVAASDEATNEDASPASRTWTVDTTAPATTILTGPADGSVTNDNDFEFTWSTEAGADYVCTLGIATIDPCDGGSFAGFDSTDGTFTFGVSGTDAAGNAEDPGPSRTWTIDTVAPDTAITVFPDDPSNDTGPTFEFTSTEAPATFECQLDTGGWAACVTPDTLVDLAEGSHTFEVRATDEAGNTDATPASYTWTVDITAPNTFIASGPEGTVTSSTAEFTFTASESPVTYECAVDGDAYAACTTPFTLTDLADGAHTISVRATDAAGNLDASPVERAWTVDATEPDTTFVSGPEGTVASADAEFTFVSDDGDATFECQLDAGDWEACTSPHTLTDLADGEHTLDVRSVDTAGNEESSPASRTWTVDTTGPVTSIDSGPEGFVSSDAADFTFSSPDDPVGFECMLDDADWAVCASPHALTDLSEGEHTFSVRATDALGNPTAAPATQSWTVDTLAPETTIVVGPGAETRSTTAWLYFRANESADGFECMIDGGDWEACTSPRKYDGLSVAEHSFAVRATDLAGNLDATPAERTWVIVPGNGSDIFNDVPTSNRFDAEIGRLFASGVTRGCGGDNFCPDGVVTRGAMAAFLVRALGLEAGTKVFSDTVNHRFRNDVAALFKAGVTSGCGGNNFCPDRPVTRGEMAAFLTRALDLPAGTKVFSDTISHRFRNDIAALAKAGITSGCGGNNFCPDQPVTRDQMAAFLDRAGLLD